MRRIKEITQITSKTTAVEANGYDVIVTTVPLTDAADASFNFVVNNDKVQTTSTIIATTEYPSVTDESSRAVTLTGTSGTANVVVGGVNYLATFTDDLTTSATNFVTSHAATLLALGIVVTSDAAVLTFVADTDGFPTISVANVSGNLAGTVASVTAISATGNPIANIVSYEKGAFTVRIQNVGTAALNYFAKVHLKLTHN